MIHLKIIEPRVETEKEREEREIGNRIIRIKNNFRKEEDRKRIRRDYWRKKNQLEKDIQTSYRAIIRGLKSMVGHSRKGKPHKKPWGMHIES